MYHKETEHETILPKANVNIVRCKTIERIQRVFWGLILTSPRLLTSVILGYVLLNLNSTVYCTKLKLLITQALITC